jgi:diaminopimelate epimerase
MKVSFTKMHGAGNDFVVIDATAARFQPDPALLRRLTDRRFGVGCDQVLVVEAPSAPDVDFDYRIFNADGSEVGQCGNGARALAAFVRARGLSNKQRLRVRTQTSVLELEHRDDGRVRVNMGAPRFAPAEIPLNLPQRRARYPLALADGRELEIGAVSMGNPHAVLLVEDVEAAPVATLGPAVQCSGLFPEGVNVGFLQCHSRQALSLRVYERGAGETLACGSGACAAVALAHTWNLVDERVCVALRGGTLDIEWAGGGAPVYMTGPAEFVFTGELEWKS